MKKQTLGGILLIIGFLFILDGSKRTVKIPLINEYPKVEYILGMILTIIGIFLIVPNNK